MFCSTGLSGEEEKLGFIDFQPKTLGSWDVQILNTASYGVSNNFDETKQENSQRGTLYEHGRQEFQPADSSWSHMVPVSSPGSSSVTATISGNNNILDFTYNNSHHRKHLLQDQISEVTKTKDLAGVLVNSCYLTPSLSYAQSVIAQQHLVFVRKLGFSHLQVIHLSR